MWMSWKRMSGVLRNRRRKKMTQGKVFKSVVKSTMIHGSETWLMKKAMEKKLIVTEMQTLRWMMGKTRTGRMQNDTIRKMAGVVASKKAQERQIYWFEYLRREESRVVWRIHDLQIEGRRFSEELKRWWRDCIGKGMKVKRI